MSFILLSILILLIESIFRRNYPEKSSKILLNRLHEKFKLFTYIADILLLLVLGVRLFLSRIEPMLVCLFMNFEDIVSADSILETIENVRAYLTLDVTPMDLSFVLVVFLAYFGVAIAPGVLCACSLAVESPEPSPYRDNSKSDTLRYSEVFTGGKLFLKLCHLLN